MTEKENNATIPLYMSRREPYMNIRCIIYKREMLAIFTLISLQDYKLIEHQEVKKEFEEERSNKRTQPIANNDFG